MSAYPLWKWLHVLSSTLLFGTGIGSAYYLFSASLAARRGAADARTVALVARQVVRADACFTATTIVFQPLSGFWLLHLAGWPLASRWVVASLALYAVALACWLPVVGLQLRMRRVAEAAAAAGAPLPAAYWRDFARWTALGVPAFVALVIVFWLMVARPS